MSDPFYSFIVNENIDNGMGAGNIGAVIPIFSEVNVTQASFIPDNKRTLEDEFQKRFDDFSNKIIPPSIPKNENVGGWDELCNKIDNFLKEKITTYYGEEFVNKIKKSKDKSKENIKEFEKKLEKLVSERSTLLVESKEIIEKSDILIDSPTYTSKAKLNNISENKILQKYNFNCSDLRKLLILYEQTVLNAGKTMSEYKQQLEKCHTNIKNIKNWAHDVPVIFKENSELDVIHNVIMKQLKKYTEECNYLKLLEDYKQSYINFLYLLSHSDNFFKQPNKCTICLTNDITHTFAPCGHCYCLACSNKIQRNKCHICRQVVKSKVKLHI